MTSFLGVPIKVRDEVYGNLYLTDKIGWTEFTSDDEALVDGSGSVAAGIAIENARLHRAASKSVAVYGRSRPVGAGSARHGHPDDCSPSGLSLQGIAGAAQATDVSDQTESRSPRPSMMRLSSSVPPFTSWG